MSARGIGPEVLLSLAERLEAGEDPKRIAGELKRMAAEKRGPGRPKDPPIDRALRKLKSRRVADEIFQGIFPEWLCPPDLVLSLKLAKGKRTEADSVAAAILGKGHSVRSIQKARERSKCPIDEFQEEKALLLFIGKPV